MDFSRRKLTMEAAAELRRLPISDVEAYRPLPSPVYVFLKRNEKFVGVKGPMDFFTDEELAKYRAFEDFFTSPFIERVTPFENEGRRLRRLLEFEEKAPRENPGYPGLTPYELSDASLRIVGPLWGNGPKIEPFFVSAFVDQFCDPIPSQILTESREKSVDEFELALYRSAVAVFCAIHLGWCRIHYLNALRLSSFERSVQGSPPEIPKTPSEEISALAFRWVDHAVGGELDPELLAIDDSLLARKLISRLERVKKELAAKTAAATIHGEEGFSHG